MRFEPIKRKPKSWHREPCAAADCKRASRSGRLCIEHGELLLAECAMRLDQYGVSPSRVAVNGGGYVSVTIDGRYILEHRLIMEHVIGRSLLPGENVHHRNGCRSDNRPQNLELWVISQPAGQRPHDLVAYARELLRRYDTVPFLAPVLALQKPIGSDW